MKKENRILKNREFLTLIKIGKKYQTSALRFYYLPNLNQTYQIGITVSKKVSKLAVVRNLIKRRIVAILIENYEFNKPYDIIIVVKPGMHLVTYETLKKEIQQFINKL